MGLSKGAWDVKGPVHRGDAEYPRSSHWLGPVETGFASECGGCSAAHWVLNVDSPRIRGGRESDLAGLRS